MTTLLVPRPPMQKKKNRKKRKIFIYISKMCVYKQLACGLHFV